MPVSSVWRQRDRCVGWSAELCSIASIIQPVGQWVVSTYTRCSCCTNKFDSSNRWSNSQILHDTIGCPTCWPISWLTDCVVCSYSQPFGKPVDKQFGQPECILYSGFEKTGLRKSLPLSVQSSSYSFLTSLIDAFLLLDASGWQGIFIVQN
jgi:hypothetical protein